MPTSPEIDSSVPNTPVRQTDSAAAGEANDLTREPVSYGAIAEAVERFKKEVIVKGMLDEEEKSDTYAKWLNLHDNQLGKDFDYLNAKGVVPLTAIISKKKTLPSEVHSKTTKEAAEKPGTLDEKDARGRLPEDDEDEEDERLIALNGGKGTADLEG
ncbi:MAG: hypothetical protein CYPHOPRED_003102 [Cyphobasidiales sp. Tagirdzhanova-0007]|nr:MAG: hypothetical protein CYPHOPRED_003102 [Cyphobasidiales sp. Tagirdzhanova-0007]